MYLGGTVDHLLHDLQLALTYHAASHSLQAIILAETNEFLIAVIIELCSIPIQTG